MHAQQTRDIYRNLAIAAFMILGCGGMGTWLNIAYNQVSYPSIQAYLPSIINVLMGLFVLGGILLFSTAILAAYREE